MNASCNKANTHKRNGGRYGGNASNSAFPVPKGILHMRVFLIRMNPEMTEKQYIG